MLVLRTGYQTFRSFESDIIQLHYGPIRIRNYLLPVIFHCLQNCNIFLINFQVFVYKRSVYASIKERLKSRGVENIAKSELINYFSPWIAQHMGQIRVASGNRTVERWANSILRISYYIFTYPSLLKLHTDPSLLRTLNDLLKNEALLQVSTTYRNT